MVAIQNIEIQIEDVNDLQDETRGRDRVCYHHHHHHHHHQLMFVET